MLDQPNTVVARRYGLATGTPEKDTVAHNTFIIGSCSSISKAQCDGEFGGPPAVNSAAMSQHPPLLQIRCVDVHHIEK